VSAAWSPFVPESRPSLPPGDPDGAVQTSPARRLACPLDHEALKRDPAAWSRLEFRGIQQSFDDHGTEIELRNCACNSTLCRPIITQRVIESAERAVAEREGIAWERVDRVWVRAEALKLIRAEHEIYDAGVA